MKPKTVSQTFIKRIAAITVGTAMAIAQFASVMASPVYSAPYTPQAAVSFTFDDGLLSTYSRAMPILESRNIDGVLYHNTAYTGKSGYMTWNQVRELQNTYGWEIGSHSVTHPLMSTLSTSQIRYEVEQSKKDLIANGINPVSFATPYGDYDNRVIAEIAKQFEAHRPFHDREHDNAYPYNGYLIYVKSVEKDTTIAQVQSWVDHAKATNTWLVLVFHEIVPSKVSDQYDVTESMLKQIADYVNSSGITVKQVRDMVTSGESIVKNTSFENGLAEGWRTDNTSSVVVDTDTNGSIPSPKRSIRITGSSQVAHLFSQTVPVSANTTYGIKAFVNQVSFKKGEYGFYLDEYDANGEWISGQWIRGVFDNNTNKSDDVFDIGYTYKPTSANVATAMLEVYMIAGSSGKIYVDNIEWYPVHVDTSVTPVPSATATPTVSPTMTATPEPTATASATPTASASATPSVTPTATASATATASPTPTVTAQPTSTPVPTVLPSPTGDNLVRNANMGARDENDFALYWTRDDVNTVVYDTSDKGCSGAESIVMLANNFTTVHVTNSRLISVDSTKSYLWGTCVIVGAGTGEFGYYLDEYDVNGTWISGQWMGGTAVSGKRVDQFLYKPTSPGVKSVGVQYYKNAGTTFDVSIDKVTFYQAQ